MPRSKLSPIINACISIAKSVGGVPVGDGTAPKCDKPYIVISSVSGPRYEGPLNDGESDASDRVQFSYIGDTREQADLVRDDVRAGLTAAALDAEFVVLGANRRTFRVILDIPRGVQRDDRGLPNPIFVGIDQYLVETTPHTP